MYSTRPFDSVLPIRLMEIKDMEYLIHGECPKCGGDVYDRALNLVEEKGLPVFSLDDFSQHSMQCDNDVYEQDVKGGEENRISKEEYEKLKGEEKEEYYLTSCDYRFGTGDIDVIGEDEW